MINYTLKCTKGHRFDSWFGSATAYDALELAGHLTCAVCGSPEVSKSLMAPQVLTAEAASKATEGPVPAQGRASSAQEGGAGPSQAEQAMAEMRQKVEDTSDYVGRDFAKQARAMHEGTAPERAIYGEAGFEQAKALVEDGVPVIPLPFKPKQKLN